MTRNKVTNKKLMQNFVKYLFSTHLLGIKTYWFSMYKKVRKKLLLKEYSKLHLGKNIFFLVFFHFFVFIFSN